MKILHAVALFSFVSTWVAKCVADAGASSKDNQPDDETTRHQHHHHHKHHRTRMLNSRYHGDDQSDAASPTHFALEKVRAEQRRQRDIGHAATCANPLTLHMPDSVRLECENFMQHLCKVGREDGGIEADLEEVKDYCASFYGEEASEDADNDNNQYKAEAMPSDYSPPPMPWSNKKQEQPLPSQGYWGKKVEHDDMKTFSSDWQMEFGPNQQGEQNVQQICKRYPNSEWCRIYAKRYGPVYGYDGADSGSSRSGGGAASSSSSGFLGSDSSSDSSDDDASADSGPAASSGSGWSIFGSFWKLVGYK